MESHDKLTLLRSIEPLMKLSTGLLARLCEATEWRDFAKGDSIYDAGDRAEHVLAVVSGKVRIYHVSEDGAELLVEEHVAPALFGEADSLTDGARKENAAADSATTVGFIPAALFLEVVTREPDAAASLLLASARRVTRASTKQKSMAFDPIPKRAAQFLLECAQRHNPEGVTRPIVPITQDVIASAVGSTRRSIASAMSAWQSMGLLVRMRHGYEIADLAAFARLAA